MRVLLQRGDSLLNHFSLAQSRWWPLESQLKLKAIKYPQKDPRTTTGPSQLTNRLKFGCSSGMIRPGKTRPRRRREGPPKPNVDTLLMMMICNSVLLHHTSSRQLHPLQAPLVLVCYKTSLYPEMFSCVYFGARG